MIVIKTTLSLAEMGRDDGIDLGKCQRYQDLSHVDGMEIIAVVIRSTSSLIRTLIVFFHQYILAVTTNEILLHYYYYKLVLYQMEGVHSQ